jgi:putative tricarboxylic transport membrane protein
MDLFSGIIGGFQISLTLTNLFFCFVGVFIGELIGVLPGIGPVGTIAILLPVTFGMNPATGIIMLAGVFYGSQYGGSRTSILVNIPGEASTIVTCFDGYPMARKGRAGPALGMSTFASFFGGVLSILGLVFVIGPLAKAALAFGPPEYFALMCVGMVLLIYMAKGSKLKAVISIFLGLALASPGTDQLTGEYRFTFGLSTLLDGIGLIPLSMGLFGVTEVLENLEEATGGMPAFKTKLRGLMPSKDDWKKSFGPISRGSIVGFLMGILPGGGAVVSTFLAYALEKKIAKHPGEFGNGAIQGLAAPEAAKDAAVGGGFIPLLALGIPPSPIMALFFSALMVHGLSVGPLFMTQHPDLFWGLVASMVVGNAMLLVLNLPLIGMWAKVLTIRSAILMPLILLFCIIGVYSTNNNPWDILSMTLIGVFGFLLKKYGYELAPIILAFVLGPLLETNFRLSLVMGGGDLSIFLTRGISAVAIGFACLLLISSWFSSYKGSRNKKRPGNFAGA